MTSNIELSIVAPLFNGADSLEDFILRLNKALESLNKRYQIILIDDGSTDDSLPLMRELQKIYPAVTIIKLKKNFGQSNAIAAGFTKAEGDYIAVMDSDLQDKPEDIILLYEKIRRVNTDMIIATRRQINRSVWRNFLSDTFYFLTPLLTRLRFPRRSGVFRIMKKKCLDHLNEALQSPGTVLSYIHASEYSWESIALPREKNKLKSSYTFGKMMRLALCRILPYNIPAQKLLGKGIIV